MAYIGPSNPSISDSSTGVTFLPEPVSFVNVSVFVLTVFVDAGGVEGWVNGTLGGGFGRGGGLGIGTVGGPSGEMGLVWLGPSVKYSDPLLFPVKLSDPPRVLMMISSSSRTVNITRMSFISQRTKARRRKLVKREESRG